MHSIPRTFIDELITRCDLIELIDARVPLKKAGQQYTACCPFHSEKSPSFHVSPIKQVYYCFGCGASGNVISFLMNYERLDFPTAIEVLAAQAGMDIPRSTENISKRPKPAADLYTLLDSSAKYYQQQLAAHPIAIEYLKQRGMTGETAKKFRVGYAPAGWDHLLKHQGIQQSNALLAVGLLSENDQQRRYDRFRNRILFPIRDQRGRIIGFGGRVIQPNDTPKYLNSPETPVFQKSKELYGLYEAQQVHHNLPRILVVEGYMDVVMLAQHGIDYAVATMGTATTPQHLQRLMSLTNEIIFCFDGDAAGQKAGWRALETALPLLKSGTDIRFLLLPPGEDPDSIVRKEGKDGFTARIQHATSLSDFFFNQLIAESDLSQIHGRAKLANLAHPLIQQIPDQVFQHLMLDRLSQLVRMDISQLKKDNKRYVPSPSPKAAPLSPMRLTILLLLQNPALAQTVKNRELLQTLTLRGSALLNELLALLTDNLTLTTGAILEHWRNQTEYEQLSQLAVQVHHVPEKGIPAEFQSLLERLIQLDRQQRIEELLLKAQQGLLEEEEKPLLQKLIAEKQSSH